MTVAFRHRRRSDDPFFADGDEVCFGNKFGSSVVVFIESDDFQGDDNDTLMTSNGQSYNQEQQQQQQQERSSELFCYPCCSPGCPEVFDSMRECEEHYETSHTKQCNICMKIFSTDHLLDLHLQECHDSYFSVAIENQRARYQCLVHTCNETFRNDTDRLIHLRQQHNYPKWFRFHPRANRMSTQNKHRPKQKKKDKMLPKTKPDDTIIQNCVPSKTKEPGTQTYKLAKKAARKASQKENRATIPCKFFISSYCRRGDKCMFLHDYTAKKKSTDDSVELITEKLNGTKVSVPDNLSFGRRKTRSILSMRQT